jgi:hypothetical protein
MQMGLACLKFADEQLGRFDGDLPHRVPRADPVSYEPYPGPGWGLARSGSRAFTQRAAVSYRFPAPEPRFLPVLSFKLRITVPSVRRSG